VQSTAPAVGKPRGAIRKREAAIAAAAAAAAAAVEEKDADDDERISSRVGPDYQVRSVSASVSGTGLQLRLTSWNGVRSPYLTLPSVIRARQVDVTSHNFPEAESLLLNGSTFAKAIGAAEGYQRSGTVVEWESTVSEIRSSTWLAERNQPAVRHLLQEDASSPSSASLQTNPEGLLETTLAVAVAPTKWDRVRARRRFAY
jgi:hypothetical protein